MCGINGIVRLTAAAPPISHEELRATRDCMAKRGPDGVGEWFSPDGRAALGHRRLAIIDLSPAADQPMVRSDRYRVVYNGEIYNYRELREELIDRGVDFETSSDTEVILALYEHGGPELLKRLRGMYTLAIWDSQASRLFLARDPYGIKPLYYSASGGIFRFASQVKALEASSSVSREIDPSGLAGFLIWGSVPEPLTIRREIRALPAGTYLEVLDGRISGPHALASIDEIPAVPSREILAPAEAVKESVRYHLVSDIPVGAFLSAGLDSATITALAARQLDEPITTFTLRFDSYRGTGLDEGPLAAAVARALGTRHIEHTVRPEDFVGLWPDVLAAMDQPSIDGFNTYLVSKIASSYGLKVVLSGLGGDELLGGYPSFRDVPRWLRWSRAGSRVPGAKALLPLLGRALPERPKLPSALSYGSSLAGAYLLRRGLFLPHEIPGILGEDLARQGLAGYDPLVEVERCLSINSGNSAIGSDWTAVHLMESKLYMRNQLLRDSDWASMAHSLELRVPFVDPMLRSQFAAADFQPAQARGKAAFLRAIAEDLPREIWQRPKSGFTVPVMAMFEDGDRPLAGATQGLDSRQLALKVLSGFGIQPLEAASEAQLAER